MSRRIASESLFFFWAMSQEQWIMIDRCRALGLTIF
jgi:hypothetical protein